MAQMITRCPACGTRFRVVPDQLRISQGWVRCGQCNEVFDGAGQLAHAEVQPEVQAQVLPSMPVPLPAAQPPVPPLHAVEPTVASFPGVPTPADAPLEMAPAWPSAQSPAQPSPELPAQPVADTESAALLDDDTTPPLLSPPLVVQQDAPQWLPHAPAEIPVADSVASLDVGLAEFVQAQAGEASNGVADDVSGLVPAEKPADAPRLVPELSETLDTPELPAPSHLPQASAPPSAGPGDQLPASKPGRLVVGLAPEAIALPLRAAATIGDAMPLPQRPAAQAPRPAPVPARVVAAPPVAPVVALDPALAELSFVREAAGPAVSGSTAGRPQRRPRARRLWLVGVAVVLLGALLWQLAVHERDRLAASAPALRPLLGALCAPFDCSVQPLRSIDALVIDGSAFHALGENGYRLSLTLRNRAAHAVAMPAIALALTDLSEQAVVRRVLMPQELGAAPPALEAHGEWTASVDLQLADNAGRARVVGYRLDLFYP